jgi:hypothetical protein
LNALGVLITKSILSKWHKTGRPPRVAFRTEKRGRAMDRPALTNRASTGEAKVGAVVKPKFAGLLSCSI